MCTRRSTESKSCYGLLQQVESLDSVVDSVLFLRQLLVVIDLVPIFEVSVGPGGSCHVCLAAPGDSWAERKKKKEKEGEKRRTTKTEISKRPEQTVENNFKTL